MSASRTEVPNGSGHATQRMNVIHTGGGPHVQGNDNNIVGAGGRMIINNAPPTSAAAVSAPESGRGRRAAEVVAKWIALVTAVIALITGLAKSLGWFS